MSRLVHMFPQSVYVARPEIDDADRRVLLEWTQQQRAEHHEHYTPPWSWSGDLHGFGALHLDPRFDALRAALAVHVRAYLDALAVAHDRLELHQVRSWATVSVGDERIAAHQHPSAHLAAVYYAQLPRGSGKLGFATVPAPNEVAPGLFSEEMEGRGHVRSRNELNTRSIVVEVAEGDLVVFPARADHFTVPGHQEGERVSIACDILLTMKQGQNSEHLLPSPALWRSV